MDRERNRPGMWDACFAALFLAVFCLYLYKIPLGIPSGDEAFYLTIPKRILQGDALAWDEWHGSQLSAFLTTPLMALRGLLFPGAEGMVLQWRYFYLAVHGLVSVTVYLRLRKKRYFGALAAALLFLFTPFDIPSLGYNILAADLTALAGAALYTAKSRWGWLGAGLAFAGAVLCTPHLVLVFLCYALGTLVWWAVKRDGELLRNGLYFCGGCAIPAAAFLIFLFCRTTPGQLWAAIPNILSDPAHAPTPLGKWAGLYGAGMLLACGKWLWWMLGLWALALADRGRSKRAVLYFLVGVALAVAMEAESFPRLLTDGYHYPLVPLALLGVLCFILTGRRDWKLFRTLFLLGVGETVAIHMASNQWVFIITAMYIVPDLAALLFLRDFMKEQWGRPGQWRAARRVAAAVLCAGMLLVQSGLMVYTKVNHKFWSTLPNSGLTVTLDRGPYKGFRVGEAAGEKYYAQLDALERALGHRAEGKSVAFPGGATWHNLVFSEMRVGSFSAWLDRGKSSTLDRWAAYYEADPGHVADYLCFFGPGKWDMEEVREKILDPWGYVAEDWGELTVYVREAADDGERSR